MSLSIDPLPEAVRNALVERGYSQEYVEKWAPVIWDYLDDIEEHMNENAVANGATQELVEDRGLLRQSTSP